MTALIEQLHINSPVVRAMLGLLPHLTPPVVLQPAPNSPLPRGCLHLPSMRLVVTGGAGPVVPALGVAEAVARAMDSDVLVVSIRPNHAIRALRYDVLFVEQDRTEHVSDLLFWTLPDRMPALVPMARGAPAAIIGKTTLIPSDAMPFRDAAERAAGVARGVSEQRLALWGEK
jgi:hypothetical protein